MTLQRLFTLMVVAVCLSQPAFAQINSFRGSGATPLFSITVKSASAAKNAER